MAYNPIRPLPSPRIRQAHADDSPGIARLFERVYRPDDGSDVLQHYPFPQLFEPGAVAGLLADPGIAWVVADAKGEVVGSAAAVRNIGGPSNRVAEVFGVAVDPRIRRRGVGSSLLRLLVDGVIDQAEFILCEARTADPGGWKVAKKAGFRPVGFAPYAHLMPTGFESMVVTGYMPMWPGRNRPINADDLPEPVLRVAASLLESDAGPLPQGRRSEASLYQARAVDVAVLRDDPAGRKWFSGPAELYDHAMGVMGICPMEGPSGRRGRFDRPYFIGLLKGTQVGCVRVLYDRTDARARVVGLRALDEGMRSPLLAGVIQELNRLRGQGPLTVVCYVRADAGSAHRELQELGFFPTAYLPGIAVAATGRRAVVQYTRLFEWLLPESTRGVTASDWPAARQVIEAVVRFSAKGASSLAPESCLAGPKRN